VSSQAGFGAELRPLKGFLLFSALRIDSPDSIIVFIVHHEKKTEKNIFPFNRESIFVLLMMLYDVFFVYDRRGR